jgi:hypothetical protein
MIGSAASKTESFEWAVLTTATETGADTIHALPSTHLIDDHISALLEPFADASGIIEGDGRIVPCGSSNGRDGKVVSVDEDRISISANGCSARAGSKISRVGLTDRTRPP